MKHTNTSTIFVMITVMKRLMPSVKTDWAEAMENEILALGSDYSQFLFAFGCLRVAAVERLRTRKALAGLGRAVLFLGLVSLGFYGIWMINNAGVTTIENAPAKTFLTWLCTAYALTGVIAACSLRLLKLYSGAAMIGAISAWLWLTVNPYAPTPFSAMYLKAISFEAGVLMAGVLFAAWYLSLLHRPEQDVL